MLGLAARRGRQQSSTLARALIDHSGGGAPRLAPKPSSEVAGSSRNWTSLTNLYEAVKVRGESGLANALRDGSRRTISNSRKVDVGVEAATAAAPAGSASKLNFVAWYLRKLDQRPLLTKSLTAGSIYTSSDLCSQVWPSIHIL